MKEVMRKKEYKFAFYVDLSKLHKSNKEFLCIPAHLTVASPQWSGDGSQVRIQVKTIYGLGHGFKTADTFMINVQNIC